MTTLFRRDLSYSGWIDIILIIADVRKDMIDYVVMRLIIGSRPKRTVTIEIVLVSLLWTALAPTIICVCSFTVMSE